MTVININRPLEAGSSPHEIELEELRRVYEEARRDGSGRAVVLYGPSATGADALLNEWKRGLHRRREHIFEGDCLQGSRVYAPLAEVVSRYVRAVEDLGLMDEALAELYAQVGRSLGIPRLMALDGPQDARSEAGGQIVFYETLGRLLTELSIRLPGVIILKDLHKADSATRAAVTYLIQNVVTDPVHPFAPDGVHTAAFTGLLALSVASESQVSTSLRRALGDHESVIFISLESATEETVRRFLTSPEVVRQFVVSSGGTTDNLKALIETIPKKVEDLFLRRCEDLTEDERELLGTLAVMGRPVAPDFVLRVLEGGAHSSALSSLYEKRVIARRVHQGQLLVDLPTEENRVLFYAGFDAERRRTIHGRIAGLLEERARFGEQTDLAELAHHFLQSEEPHRAVEYGIGAAERLHISFAYERAIELLEAILPVVADDAVRREVLDRLVDLHAGHSEHRRALYYCGLLKKAVAVSEQGPLHRRIGEMLLELGKYKPALRILEKGRQLVGDSTGADRLDELVRIDTVTVEAYYGCGQYDRVVSLSQSTLAKILSSPSADAQRQVVRLTNTIGKVFLFREDYRRAQRAFEENVQRCRDFSWPEEEVRARFNLGTIALHQRDYPAADEIFTQCLNFGLHAQNPIVRAFCLMNLGVVYHKTHRYEQALDAYLHGLATFKKSGNELQFAVVAMNLAALYQTIGDLVRARALIETSLEVTSAQDIKFYQGWGEYVKGGIAADTGEFPEATQHLNGALQIMEGLGSASWVERIQVRQAQLAYRKGDFEGCVTLASKTSPAPQSTFSREMRAEAALWTGKSRLAQRQFSAAHAELSRSRDIFSELGVEERIWLTDLALAETALESDDRAAGLEYLERARKRIETLERQVPSALVAAYQNAPDRKRVSTLLEESVQRTRAAKRRQRNSLSIPTAAAFEPWRARYDHIIGEDPRLLQIFRVIDKIADSDSTVLVQGESGTGKELIAEALHRNSGRANQPFVKVNCAAFVETLLLSELFGHEKGAFTGALTRKKGRFELAHGGTILLDEIGDISPNTQVALLRVLQERAFDRVGGTESIDVDVRVIVATNRNLEEMVKRGDFRHDLYYRLKGILIELPPLRERRQDAVRLLRHFVEQYQARPQSFSLEALDFLARYSWPGNIRELENFTRSLTLFVDDPIIHVEHVLQFQEFFADGEILDALPEGFFDTLDAVPTPEHAAPVERPAAPVVQVAPPSTEAIVGFTDPQEALVAWAMREGVGLPELRRRLELECIKGALHEARGNITKAAGLLEMKRPRLSQIINANPELSALKSQLASA